MTSNTPNNAQTKTPCLVCPHRDTEGNSCALLCLRLAAFNSGKDWEEEPLPYISKHQKKVVKIMGETETGDPIADSKNVCVICHDLDKPILNKRSQTCGSCYQAWNVGKIDHPTLGHFKPSLTKSKTKTSSESQPKATRSYPFPDLVTLDFTDYPDLKNSVFKQVDKYLLPVTHIIMSLLAATLAGKKED